MGDWPLHILNAEHGDIWFMKEVMGAYRIHEKGRWSSMNMIDKKKKIINSFYIINSYLNNRFESEIMASVWKNWLEISKLYALDGESKQSRNYFMKCIKNYQKRGNFSIINIIKYSLVVFFPYLYNKYKNINYK